MTDETTLLRHPVTGGEWEAPTDSVDAWTSPELGWEAVTGSRTPSAVLAERVAADEAHAARIDQVAQLVTGDTTPTIAEIEAQVGDDPDAALVALQAEQARPTPRTTLVERLTKIATQGGHTEENHHG